RGIRHLAGGVAVGRDRGREGRGCRGRHAGPGGLAGGIDDLYAFGADGDRHAARIRDDVELAIGVTTFDLDRIFGATEGNVLTGTRSFEGHCEVARYQQDRPDDDGLARSKILVCNHSADNGQQIDQRSI
ncbi:MAG: hypothetical protein ACK559_26460, partial [bacterium]